MSSVAFTVITGGVITESTATAGSAPPARKPSERSRSVTMPRRFPSSVTRTEPTPRSAITRTTSLSCISSETDTTGRLVTSEIFIRRLPCSWDPRLLASLRADASGHGGRLSRWKRRMPASSGRKADSALTTAASRESLVSTGTAPSHVGSHSAVAAATAGPAPDAPPTRCVRRMPPHVPRPSVRPLPGRASVRRTLPDRGAPFAHGPIRSAEGLRSARQGTLST